ncbi:putative ribonuclease H-like domain-containing protein [Tanacetum coccineum]
MRPFGCPVTFPSDKQHKYGHCKNPLGKFDGKAEEGFLVGGQGPNWLFDIDSLTNSMNYQPVTAGNQTNKNAGPQEANVDTADDAAGETPIQKPASENEQALKNILDKMMDQEKEASEQSDVVRKDTPVNAASASRTSNDVGPSSVPLDRSFPLNVNDLPDDPLMSDLEDTTKVQNTSIFGSAFDDEDLDTYNSLFADQVMGAKADFNNIKPSTVQEPTKITQALDDESWVEAMQEELLQFKIHKVWTLVGQPYSKKAIGIKWVYRNKKDKRGIVVRNKVRLVAQGYKQEEGINYDEVFAHIARIEAIRLFLAYASFMNFLVYQMDVKSAFLYGTIDEEVYVRQPPVFVDPEFPDKVYKVEKALYGLHQAPRAWYATLSIYLLDNGFYRGQIDKTLFIKRVKDDILLEQVYVDDIIFGSTKKSLCTDFEQIMHKWFQMSSMGELTCLLGFTSQADSGGLSLVRIMTMQTKIHVDNESVICVVKNPVYHSKTKHIEIRHHLIRDSYDKRFIKMVKIPTDNVADLLTKAFDVSRFNFLVASICMLNLVVDDLRCGYVFKLVEYNKFYLDEVRMDYNWIGVRVERAITTAASLDAALNSDNIIRTQTTKMPNVDILQGMDTGG